MMVMITTGITLMGTVMVVGVMVAVGFLHVDMDKNIDSECHCTSYNGCIVYLL